MSRFDYVAYDGHSATMQGIFKQQMEELEAALLVVGEKAAVVAKAIGNLKSGRARELAAVKINAIQIPPVLTSVEESYMWIGKAIRDEQIERNGSAPLQEARGDS